MISERELRLVSQNQSHSDIYAIENTIVGNQFAVFANRLCSSFAPDLVRVIRKPSLSLDTMKPNAEIQATADPVNQNHPAVDLSLITRGTTEDRDHNEFENMAQVSVTPIVSLAPFLSQGHPSARVLVSTVSPEHADASPSAFRNNLQRLKCIIDAFEGQSTAVFFDEYDSQSEAFTYRAEKLLASVGITPCGIYTFEDGFSKITKKPDAFGTIICMSERGRWVESALRQALSSSPDSTTMTWSSSEQCVTGIENNDASGNTDEPRIGSLILGTVLALIEAGNSFAAAELYNAWLSMVEKGLHTKSEFHWSPACRRVAPSDFIDAIIEAKGQKPQKINSLNPTRHSAQVSRPRLTLVQ